MRDHPGVVKEKLGKEIQLGRMLGPFLSPPIPNLRISPLGMVPQNEAGRFRLIHHLLYLKGTLVNDNNDYRARVSYTSLMRRFVWSGIQERVH